MSHLLLLLLLILLSLSLHACSVRHLDVNSKDSSRLLQHSSKDVEDVGVTTIPAKDHLKAPPKSVELGGTREMTTPGVVRTESAVTVAWLVPHEKHKEQPGFTMDYEAPTSHPPSIN